MMVEYTRKQEEEKLVNGIEEDYRKLQTAEDRELDTKKLSRLILFFFSPERNSKVTGVGPELQQISSNVYVLKEEKDEIENSMEKVRREYESEWENKEAQMELEEQQIRLDRQLIRVRSHLAQGTKVRLPPPQYFIIWVPFGLPWLFPVPHGVDRQLIRIRSHLAQGTKDLEDITTENAKLEHEIALLRMQREKKEPTENGVNLIGRFHLLKQMIDILAH
ncbi:hypothetical protein BSL78_25900 [Apostichopus japonicus]|uniref:Pleckstrin homology domain-containing protein n=1 Tax=Stichopus japonicus TaxID=307972 RepID=A0A2G8JNH5_STIJA|nr:hypothetical protein BSL78_25900 [Apostichopus japonicus]